MNTKLGEKSGLAGSDWCVIGGGNMASAIVLGAIDAGAIGGERFVVVEIDETKRQGFSDRGILAVAEVREGMKALQAKEKLSGTGHVLLAVKPQMLDAVAGELRPSMAEGKSGRRIVSILAGTPTSKLESELGPTARVIRAMPNTPARIRRGTTAFALGRSARPGDEDDAAALFASLGTVLELDESLFDAFTAIAGSGPAYLFYLAEGLVRSAVEQGFTAAEADSIVRSMLAGSAELLKLEKNNSPEALRAAVTSKGGTTAAATNVLDDAKVLETLVKAIAAATDRGRELSQR